MSSGGISSRVSGSVLSGSDDGSKIFCAFHGEANSPLTHGMVCAFADDPRPSRMAATGAGSRLKRRRPRTRMKRHRSPFLPDAYDAISNPDPITHALRECEGGEHLRGKTHRSKNDRRLRIRTAGLILGYAGARFLTCEIEVMRSPATRLAGKS